MLKLGHISFYLRRIREALAGGERFDAAYQPVPVAMRYPSPATRLFSDFDGQIIVYGNSASQSPELHCLGHCELAGHPFNKCIWPNINGYYNKLNDDLMLTGRLQAKLGGSFAVNRSLSTTALEVELCSNCW